MIHKHLAVAGVWALLALAGQAVAVLPPDLDAVPRDAAAFMHVRAADVWKHDVAAEVRHFVEKAGPAALKDFQKMFVPDPADIERVTFVAVNARSLGEPIPYRVDPDNVSALVIFATKKPYDRFKVIEKLGFREKFYKRNLYYFNEELWSGLVLLDDKTFLFGAEDSVVAYFDQAGTRTGPLQAALEEASKPHLAVIGWNPQSVKGDNLGAVPPNIQPLFQAQCMIAALDVNKEIKLDLSFAFADADKATAGGKALQDALDMFRALLILPINQVEAELKRDPDKVGLDDLPERFGMLFALGFLRDLEDMLKNAKIETKGTTVRYPFEYSKVASAQQSTVLMLAFVSVLGRSANATFSRVGQSIGGEGKNEEHLKKVAEALEKYHADKGHYPPAAILDKDGRPLLSWRVDLLPYLGEQEVYSQFNLDEPWDSLHNKKLLKKMPEWLRQADRQDFYGGENMKCVDFLLTGPGAPFAGKTGPKRGDFDAKSVFVLFTESNEPGVYWTKPADVKHQAGQPLKRLFGENARQVHVLLKDGTYKAYKSEEEKALRDLFEKKK